MTELPPIQNEMRADHINSRPDGGYALRILRHYRERANEKWDYQGPSEGSRLLYAAMNEHQDQRAKELDAAIAVLEAARKEAP